MAGDDDEAKRTDDGYAIPGDPSSGPRTKRVASTAVQIMVADFQRRAAGLDGTALDAEFEKLVTRIVENHVAAAPKKLREEVRAMLYEKLAHDPTLTAALENMRSSARARAK